MIADRRFGPGERVFVRHTDAVGNVRYWDDGEILDFVNSTPQGDIYRLTFGGFGVNFLMSEVNLRPYKEHVDGTQAFGQGGGDNARIQARDVAFRVEERAQGEK